jgi:hypothetical protein
MLRFLMNMFQTILNCRNFNDLYALVIIEVNLKACKEIFFVHIKLNFLNKFDWKIDEK